MSGKGSKQRPGTGYADNYDAIFRKKRIEEFLFPEDGAPKLMTLSEAQKAGYSMEYVNCGPSVSGAVIRVGKWDDARNCLQYIDVRPDEPQPKTCQHCKHYGVIKYNPLRCENPIVKDMLDHDNWDSLARMEPPADFGCLRWEAKA